MTNRQIVLPAYHRGTWDTHILQLDTDNLDRQQELGTVGYMPSTDFHPGGDSPLTVQVYRRAYADPPQVIRPDFLIDINLAGTTQTVAARDVVDLMDVLAQWAPVIQASVACVTATRALHAED